MLCWLGSISKGGGIGLASKAPEIVHGVGGVDRGIPFPFTPSQSVHLSLWGFHHGRGSLHSLM